MIMHPIEFGFCSNWGPAAPIGVPMYQHGRRAGQRNQDDDGVPVRVSNRAKPDAGAYNLLSYKEKVVPGIGLEPIRYFYRGF